MVEPEIITPENLFGEELSFQFYELSSPSQIQSAWHMGKNKLRLIVIDELHVQNNQDCDQVENGEDIHSGIDEKEFQESMVESWFFSKVLQQVSYDDQSKNGYYIPLKILETYEWAKLNEMQHIIAPIVPGYVSYRVI